MKRDLKREQKNSQTFHEQYYTVPAILVIESFRRKINFFFFAFFFWHLKTISKKKMKEGKKLSRNKTKQKKRMKSERGII